MMIGSHVVKFWSSTQARLALSSGEAEYYGVVRAAGIGLGQQALYRDAGLEVPIRIWTDSSAAMGTSARQGLGKLRHLECHSLWLQQRLRRKQFELLKVPGEENPADLFTKHLESEKKLMQFISLFNCQMRGGRAASAPLLKRDQGQPVALAQTQTTTTEYHICCNRLPHQFNDDERRQCFEMATPTDEPYGETDQTQEAELADPVPLLERRPWDSSQSRATSKPRRGVGKRLRPKYHPTTSSYTRGTGKRLRPKYRPDAGI